MTEPKSMQERADEFEKIADDAMVERLKNAAKNLETIKRELRRRGYDIDGKSDEQIEAVLKRPPTLQPKP